MSESQTMKPKIALIAGHSLFSDGLASKLREYSNSFEVRVFDDQQDDFNELTAFQPFAVILEDNGIQENHSWSPQRLLGLLPGLLIIFLSLGQSEIMVIHGEQYAANGALDLMTMIQQSSDQSSQIFLRAAKKVNEDQFIRQ